MNALLRDLRRNLASGARLALARPVSLLSFRISAGQLAALCAFGLLLSIAVDRLSLGSLARFNAFALPEEVLYLGQPELALALPLVIAASVPVLHVAPLVSALLPRPTHAWRYLPWAIWILWWLWLVFVIWRSLAVALVPRRSAWRSGGAAVCVVAAMWLVQSAFPFSHWWYPPGPAAVASQWPSPASEQVLAAQPGLLDDALADLDDERPGVVDLYFVGFAPYADEDVFRKDVELALKLMDDRFDTDGRSIALINNPRTSLEHPLATASNLRETLNEIGAAIDPDEDVVMLYITSHGSADHRISVEFAPLQLEQITPASLRKMFDDSGIKWRILVVSACYSGGFIDALKEEHTLVITASATDRSSFGCGSESELTYFGDALFNRGLRFEDSFEKAFETARAYIAEREKAEGQSPPSNPQWTVGEAMKAKLAELERGLHARRSGGAI
jgi:hypothetical protein